MTWLLLGVGACVLSALLVLALVAIAPRIDERQEWEEREEAEDRARAQLAATERWRARQVRSGKRRRGVR